MRNVSLPPSPPASSAPSDGVADTMQEGPLDLSSPKRPCPPLLIPSTPIKRSKEIEAAEVEIIAMTTRPRPSMSANTLLLGSSSAFQPPRPQQRYHHHLPTVTAEIHRVRIERKPVARSIQRVPVVRPSQISQHQAPPLRQSPDNGNGSRPFLLPLRPLATHWKTFQSQQQRNDRATPNIRPEVHLHPVNPRPPPPPPPPPAQSVQPGQQQHHYLRFFPPQQVLTATNNSSKKPGNIGVNGVFVAPPMMITPPTPPPLPPTPPQTPTFSSDWPLRSCVVCSRRADFRCAGCHGNAYCSQFSSSSIKVIDPLD